MNNPPPTNAGALLTAAGVEKSFRTKAGPLAVLRGVSLDVSAGECVLITGPSGSGKTTLLMILAGMMHPTAGAVTIDGEAITLPAGASRRRLWSDKVGFVFQAFHLLPYLSAADNVRLGMRGADRRGRAHEKLNEVGLQQRADAKPATLSAGEQQRVAIARATANNPPLLLADEPTGNLDPDSADRVHALLAAARDRGGAVIIVSHRSETAAIADRVLRLDSGVLTEA